MKIRLTACCFALVSILATANVFAQDCAPCAAAGSCPSCAPCASCTGSSCELLGGLRSLLVCRPCAAVPICTTPVCSAPQPCNTAVAPCGPINASKLPSCAFESPSCAAPVVCRGPMFPYLKPCLYNAVHRPVNGVRKMVHGAFSALACVTTPKEDCGFFKPAYVAEITCGSCAPCGPIESAPVPAPAPCSAAVPSSDLDSSLDSSLDSVSVLVSADE